MEKDREGRALSKPRRKSGGGKPQLSEEERSLWEHAASDLKPLRKKKPRVQVGQEEQAVQKSPRRTEAVHMLKPKGSGENSPQGVSTKQASAKSAPAVARLERRKARKISSGRIEIEARIDLHGMRQKEAHAVLRRFLLNAHTKGQRWVLVITGKGTSARVKSEEYDYAGPRPDKRGIIKRNVPYWLDEPQLRAIIISYTQATARHGGEGALYIQLRKRRRASPEQ